MDYVKSPAIVELMKSYGFAVPKKVTADLG